MRAAGTAKHAWYAMKSGSRSQLESAGMSGELSHKSSAHCYDSGNDWPRALGFRSARESWRSHNRLNCELDCTTRTRTNWTLLPGSMVFWVAGLFNESTGAIRVSDWPGDFSICGKPGASGA